MALQKSSKIVIFFLKAIKLIFIRNFIIKYFKYVFCMIISLFLRRSLVRKELGRSDIWNVFGFKFERGKRW